MKKGFWNRRIPTLIGLVVLTIGVILTTLLATDRTIFQIKAGPGQDPKRIEITNITDSSFTVSYSTDDKVIGTLIFGKNPNLLDSIALDDRDQLSQSVNKYTSHSITLKDLSSKTKYYFSITSGDKKYLNNSSPYNTETGNVIEENPSSQIPLSGKVIFPDGTSPSEGLVYVNISGAQKSSTLIKNDGTYTLSLNNLRNISLDVYFKITDTTIIPIEVISKGLTSSVSISPEDLSPVPLITLSNNYDFSKAEQDTIDNSSDQTNSFPTFGELRAQGGTDEDISLVPTQTPTVIPTSTKTVTPIPSPSVLPTPSAAPSVTVLPSPISEISPAPTIPPTGNSSVIIASIVLIAAAFTGTILFLLTRGQNSL